MSCGWPMGPQCMARAPEGAKVVAGDWSIDREFLRIAKRDDPGEEDWEIHPVRGGRGRKGEKGEPGPAIAQIDLDAKRARFVLEDGKEILAVGWRDALDLIRARLLDDAIEAQSDVIRAMLPERSDGSQVITRYVGDWEQTASYRAGDVATGASALWLCVRDNAGGDLFDPGHLGCNDPARRRRRRTGGVCRRRCLGWRYWDIDIDGGTDRRPADADLIVVDDGVSGLTARVP